MLNLSSLSSPLSRLLIGSSASIGGFAVYAVITGVIWPALVFGSLILLLAFYGYRNQCRSNDFASTIHDVLREAENGNLQHRVTKGMRVSRMAGIACNVNNLLDQVETYIREVEMSFNEAAEDRFYRRPMNQGMHGAFGESLNQINKAFNAMEEAWIMRNQQALDSRIGSVKTNSLIKNLGRNQSDL